MNCEPKEVGFSWSRLGRWAYAAAFLAALAGVLFCAYKAVTF